MNVYCILSDHRAFKSKSPAMHSAVMRQYGLDAVYVPFAVRPERLAEAAAGIRALGISGANVTVPYKESIAPFLDERSPEVQAIGAVNTIVRDGDRLIGHNTDAGGFIDAVSGEGFNIKGKIVMVIGTGGAARAIVFGLAREGAQQILVAGRTLDRAAIVSGDPAASPVILADLVKNPCPAELIVNATSVSAPEEAPEMAEWAARLSAPQCRLIIDANYGRKANIWYDLAQTCRASFLDGLTMLAHQARRSFSLWTGLEPDTRDFFHALAVPS